MKLEVPFFRQTTKLNCGPSALKMILSYFGKEIEIEELEKRTEIKEGKGIFTIQIAIASALSGNRAEFYSKQVTFNKENLKLDFYQKYADLSIEIDKLVEQAKTLGIRVEEKTMGLEKILENVNEHTLPIVLLDWNVVKNEREKGYQGHFVPVVGYDENNIYVHNHGFSAPETFLPIKKEIFEEARKAKGTDEDIIFIHR